MEVLGWIDHDVPFQRSIKTVRPPRPRGCADPTAKQLLALVQVTASSAAPVRLRVGSVLLLPRRAVPVLDQRHAGKRPGRGTVTARAARNAAQFLRRRRGARHRSASTTTYRSTARSVCAVPFAEPTATHIVAVGQATLCNVDCVVPAGVGAAWSDHLVPFQMAASGCAWVAVHSGVADGDAALSPGTRAAVEFTGGGARRRRHRRPTRSTRSIALRSVRCRSRCGGGNPPWHSSTRGAGNALELAPHGRVGSMPVIADHVGLPFQCRPMAKLATLLVAQPTAVQFVAETHATPDTN